MKNLLLTACLIAGFTSATKAQGVNYSPSSSSYGIDTKPLRFGAYLAPTMAWMTSTSKTDGDKNYAVSNDGSKVGFMYGLIMEYYFQPNYAFVTGLQMNMGGGKMSMARLATTAEKSTIQKASFDYSISLIEIPVALKLRTNPIGDLRFFGQAGVTLGIRTAKKASYQLTYFDENAVSQNVSKEKDKLGSVASLKPGFSPVNFQMNIGLGIEYPLSQGLAAYAGVFFNNGFVPDMTNPSNYALYNTTNQKIDVNSTFADGNVRFNNIALRLGIFF